MVSKKSTDLSRRDSLIYNSWLDNPKLTTLDLASIFNLSEPYISRIITRERQLESRKIKEVSDAGKT